MFKAVAGACFAASIILVSPAAAQAPARSIQLSKVLLDTMTIEATGKIRGGTLCVFPDAVKLPKVKKIENHERYEGIFAGKAKGRGYKVVATSQDLFAAQDAAQSADYLIGATVRPVTINGCSSVNGMKGEITLQVEWQIFDRAAQKVVETATFAGTGSQPKFANDGVTEIWNKAFGASLLELMKSGTLKKYTGEPDAAIAAATEEAEAKAAAAEAAALAAEAARRKGK